MNISMPMPKIVLITLEYPPERGGIARYLGSLVTESKGAIEVIAESYHDMTGPGRVRKVVLFRDTWPRWWPLVHICRQQRTRKHENTKTQEHENTRAREPIILVSHVLPVGTAAWISRLMGGPKYAVLFHGLDLRLIQSFWKRWLVRRIARGAMALIVNSRATERELQRIIPDVRPEILTPGVRRPATEIPTKPKTVPRVISIARFVSRKGLDVAIQAVGRIQKEFDVEYVIIGAGPDLKRLEDIASVSNTRIRWISRPSDEEKWSWLASSDVFLLPVRDEGNDVEGFGIVFLEAASVGVPSIAGRSGGATEAVLDGETGIVAYPSSVQDVESALRKLLCDEHARRRMGKKAKKRAETDFQWSDRWAKLQSILFPVSSRTFPYPANASSVAVVIPCFNHSNILRRTLKTLIKQTILPKEIVVVDDGSTDDPESVAKEFNVRFIRFNVNRGASAARNHGFQMTTAPYVMFLDADVELRPNALEHLTTKLEAHPEADVAYPNFYWGAKLFLAALWDIAELRKRNYIHTSALIRRTAFPGFDERVKKFQDWDLWLTMATRGSRGIWINDALYRIEPRRNGMSVWLPRIAYKLPWPIFGWVPKEIKKYREAERVIREKHLLSS